MNKQIPSLKGYLVSHQNGYISYIYSVSDRGAKCTASKELTFSGGGVTLYQINENKEVIRKVGERIFWQNGNKFNWSQWTDF